MSKTRIQPLRLNARRGYAALLAMLFMITFATLTVAMVALANMNVQTAGNFSDVTRARALAESGLRWQIYHLSKVAHPRTTAGVISSSVYTTVWTALVTNIKADWNLQTNTAERGTFNVTASSFSSAPIAIDSSAGRFQITITNLGWSSDLNASEFRIYSTGTYGSAARGFATRTVYMDFRVDKKINYAVVGKVPIQIGTNTLVEGPLAMATANKYPPLYSLSDFRHLTPALTTKVNAFYNWVESNYGSYDNRVPASAATTAAGYSDYNGDGFVDDYDLFVKEFDKNGDKAISKAEFTDSATGKLYDQNLFDAIDSLGGPLYAGDSTRLGYQDGVINDSDGYAKIHGQVTMATTASAWQTNLSPSGLSIHDEIVGPVTNDSVTQSAIQFGVASADILDLAPSNFNTLGYRSKTSTDNGTTSKTTTTITNATLAVSDANGGTTTEKTPFGSTSFQATYKRPVFKNLTLKNVRIPKGLNALFQNCTFQGVTYVELTTNITDSSGNTTSSSTDGMTYAQKMKSGTFSSSTALSTTNSYGFDRGNNLRFDNCAFNGPLATGGTDGTAPTAYTHFANSWEFTGTTYFNNQADQTATIVASQTNIEMGSFTDPTQAPSTLVGVVVAGNIDIRGTSVVDGSIIVTGDGAGNTTLGYFGPSDSDTNPSALPEGGYGRLNIRYNPYRALPDGINIPVTITTIAGSYREAD